MPIDYKIIAGLDNSPVIDSSKVVNLIAQSQQRRMQQETHAQQTQLHQQQIEAGQRAANAARIKERGAEISRQAYIDVKGDPKAHIAKVVEMGGDPDTVMGLQKHYADLDEKVAKIESDKLPVKKYQNEQLMGLAAQEIDHLQKDPQGFAVAWPSYVQQHNQIDKSESGHLDPSHIPTAQDLQLYSAAHGTLGEFYKQSDEKRAQAKAQQDATAAAQATELQAGKVAKGVADAQLATDTAAGRKPIQPEEQARLDLQKLAQEQTATHNAATEKNATALLRVYQAGDARAEQIYEQTYGSGANPALVGVEPKLRVQASSAAQKAADEYTKSVEAAATMKTFLDLAQSGNKLAYAYAPTTGVLTINTAAGVKRVNMAEIKSYAGAGSAADQVEAWLGKHISGASISADVLKNMGQVHEAMAANAATNYNTKLGGINQNYRSNFQPVKVAGHGGGPAVGAVEDGHRFKGGDPSKPDNWEIVR